MPAFVYIENGNFPNKTLYLDELLFASEIMLKWCNCKIIRSRFDTRGYLYKLSLKGMTLHVDSEHAFHEFLKIRHLEFEDCSISGLGNYALKNLRFHLESFRLTFIPDTLSFSELFQDHIYMKLNEMRIRPLFPTMKILARDNFTSLPALETLDMRSCGLEIIYDDAFEDIPLKVLILTNNNLKHISLVWFRRIIDQSTAMTFITLTDNNLACGCDLNAVFSLSYWTATYKTANILSSSLQCVNDDYYRILNVSDLMNEPCPDYGVIRPEKFGINRLELKSYLHPINSVKTNKFGDTLFIKSKLNCSIRIWLQNVVSTMDQCPKRPFLTEHTRCVSLNSGTGTVSIRQLLHRTDFNLICAQFVSGEQHRFWPLNCIGVYRDMFHLSEQVVILHPALLWSMISVLGFALSTILFWVFHDRAGAILKALTDNTSDNNNF